MSAIYFHSQSEETARLSGSERAYYGGLVGDIFKTALHLLTDEFGVADNEAVLRHVVDPTHPCAKQSGEQFIRSLALHTGSSSFGPSPLIYEGKPVALFDAHLNTALAFGSDSVKLAARLHGQCEVHAYVEGGNRKWLADLFQQGLATGIFRSKLRSYNQGYDEVIKLLLCRDDEPVVTSYSVCDSFPNAGVARFESTRKDHYDEPDPDEWYEKDKDERWELALKGLRDSGGGLELNPDDWEYPEFHFGSEPFTGHQLWQYAIGQWQVK